MAIAPEGGQIPDVASVTQDAFPQIPGQRDLMAGVCVFSMHNGGKSDIA